MLKICISVTPHALDPVPSVTNCHTFSDPLPLERDVPYGRPLGKSFTRSHRFRPALLVYIACTKHLPSYLPSMVTPCSSAQHLMESVSFLARILSLPAVIYCRRSLHLEFLTTSCPLFSHRDYLSLSRGSRRGQIRPWPPSKLSMEFGPLGARKSNDSIVNLSKCK